MAAREGKPSMSGAAKARVLSRKSFLFGLSLLAAAAFFDARPAAAQSLNLGPLQFNLGGGGYYRGRGRYHGRHGGYHGRHHSYRYGHRHHGGGRRHHGGGHHGGGGVPVPKI